MPNTSVRPGHKLREATLFVGATPEFEVSTHLLGIDPLVHRRGQRREELLSVSLGHEPRMIGTNPKGVKESTAMTANNIAVTAILLVFVFMKPPLRFPRDTGRK